MKKIKLFDLTENNLFKKILLKKLSSLFNRQTFVKGKEITQFENKFAKSLNAKHCVSCNSGTDALFLILKSLKIQSGDEVITTAQSWISTSEVIKNCKAKPIFVDTKNDFNINEDLIEKKITNKTKAIIVVHLYGYPANITKIKNICNKKKIFLIEDCAQAHFSKFNKKFVGTFGDASAFSFFPTKNLGSYGDAGCVITNNKSLYKQIKVLANHGSNDRKNFKHDGINSRMDTIQSIVLNEKLKKIKVEINFKQKIYKHYFKLLSKTGEIEFPDYKSNRFTNYHLLTLRCSKRNKLKKFLKTKGIDTGIYYDFLLPKLSVNKHSNKIKYKSAEEDLKKILSFPINKNLSLEDVNYICKNIKIFYRKVN